VAVVGNALELGENNRFALLVEPYLLCLLTMAPSTRAAAVASPTEPNDA
jgi:hypothetical protein